MKKLVLAAAVSTFMTMPAAAADLIVQDGKLVGASNVLIDGKPYDVAFLDGSCAEIFDGCDSSSDFVFSSWLQAFNASNEINAQVFNSSSIYGQRPELTNGCSDTTWCWAWIPYQVERGGYISIQAAVNNGISNDFVNGGLVMPTTSFAGTTDGRAESVYAKFSLASAVPEPGTWAMMLVGFGAIGFSMRRQRRGVAALATS